MITADMRFHVGLSMGGGYALEMALRYPERVVTLTLASPGSTTPLRARPCKSEAGQVKVPTLVMIGALDAPHMIQAGEEAEKRIPGARKIVYAGVGHMINMEEARQFN